MQISIVGLAGYGARITQLLCRADIHVLGFDADSARLEAMLPEPGFEAAFTLDALLNAQLTPRIIIVATQSGKPTRLVIDELQRKLGADDIVLLFSDEDYARTIDDADAFRRLGIGCLDVGCVDSVQGAKEGICLMIGGDATAVQRVERVWNALTVDPNQWLHCGPSGAGHFGKTIHDATATTMRQAVSEGVALLAGKREFDFDTGALAECWRHAGGVQSNALDVIATQLRQGRAPNAASIVTPADAAQIERAVIESARQRSATPTIAAAAMLHFGRSEK